MRLFIALNIPDKIINSVVDFQKQLKKVDNKTVKWVKGSSMHLTLKFLGEVSETDIEKVINSLNTIKFNKATLSIKGLGAFPKLNRARVLWTGIHEINESGESENLVKLAGDIDNAMHEIGFEKEKRNFKPHLTLGRVKKKLPKQVIDIFKEKQNNLDFGSYDYSEIILYQSILKPTGAEYEIVKKFFPQQ
jgi:2'-5' RNA ligase